MGFLQVSRWVTTVSQCETDKVTHLCIPSPSTSLSRESELSIGGTINNNNIDFWFFCTTSVCHGGNSLLSLFVIARTDKRFSLNLPKNGHDLTNQMNFFAKWSEITGPTKKYHFATSRKDELFFVKTYRFTKEELLMLKEYPLLLPCAIKVTDSYRVHPDILIQLKLQYTDQANTALYRARHEGDFVIESRSRTKFPVHLVVAAAHSSILREAIRSNNKSYSIDLPDEEVEILIEYLYKGSIENMSLGNAPNIIKLGHIMKLPGLLELGEIVLSSEINAGNAVELAVLAKKYHLQGLSLKVLDYIKQNPQLLFSSSIESLDDVDLMRSMLQHIGKVSGKSKSENVG